MLKIVKYFYVSGEADQLFHMKWSDYPVNCFCVFHSILLKLPWLQNKAKKKKQLFIAAGC